MHYDAHNIPCKFGKKDPKKYAKEYCIYCLFFSLKLTCTKEPIYTKLWRQCCDDPCLTEINGVN